MSETEIIDIAPGQIRFYDSYEPLLTTGRYEIKVEQIVDLSGIHHELALPGNDAKVKVPLGGQPSISFSQSQVFHVDGPRFRLQPADVQAVYPPPNREGNFSRTLPHVVLRRRSLPWEVRIDPGPGSAGVFPWLALLLFHPGEEPFVQTVSLKQLSEPGSDPQIARPELTNLNDLYPEPQSVMLQAIDVPLDTLRAIAPMREDLPFLAHVREVNTGGKELLGLEADGWFSVVLSNRLPSEEGLNTAHLVSLEGWEKRLPSEARRQSPMPAGTTSVRLVSLTSWSFTTHKGPASFGAIVSSLGVDMLRMQPKAGSTNTGIGAALERGYVPLAYDMRSGERSLGWYRGPMIPINLERVARDPFPSAEAGLIYDPDTGIFDVSYAVAWQIGRLLALSDGPFAKALARWRQDSQRLLDRVLELDEITLELREKTLLQRLDDLFAKTDVEQKRQGLIEFLKELDNPRALTSVAATAFLEKAVPSLDLTKPSPTGKARLSRGASRLTVEQLAALEAAPLGLPRLTKLNEILEEARSQPRVS